MGTKTHLRRSPGAGGRTKVSILASILISISLASLTACGGATLGSPEISESASPTLPSSAAPTVAGNPTTDWTAPNGLVMQPCTNEQQAAWPAEIGQPSLDLWAGPYCNSMEGTLMFGWALVGSDLEAAAKEVRAIQADLVSAGWAEQVAGEGAESEVSGSFALNDATLDFTYAADVNGLATIMVTVADPATVVNETGAPRDGVSPTDSATSGTNTGTNTGLGESYESGTGADPRVAETGDPGAVPSSGANMGPVPGETEQ